MLNITNMMPKQTVRSSPYLNSTVASQNLHQTLP